MTSDPESKGWWQTLPGLMTAGAAVITAITGLLVAIHQAGLFDRKPQPPAEVQGITRSTGDNPHPTSAESSPALTPAGITASRPLTLPAMTTVRSGDNVFKLLSARLDPYSPDKVSLHLTVRMTNNGRFPANFWAASFRLMVGDSLRTPTNNLNELVQPQSDMEGDVEFVIPASVSTAGLQMGDVGEGKPAIALNLQAPR